MEYINGHVRIRINTKRLKGDLRNAQARLDQRIINDCEPLVPQQGGNLRGSVINNTVLGEGRIVWAEPYAHYMYEGKAMVGVDSRSAYAKEGEPKEYNGKTLNYHKSGTGPKWFEIAKKRYLKRWIKLMKNVMKGKQK